MAVVTGGSRGIGRAVAEGFAAAAAAAADVVIASSKLDNCVTAADEIAAVTGRQTLPVACHVGRSADCDRLVDEVHEAFGRCDVLVNNAGVSPLYDGLPSVTEALCDKVHAVNARGPFRLSALFGERMAAADGGSISDVSTAGSLRPMPSDLPDAMAKAGLNALTLPGAFDADTTDAWSPEFEAQAGAMNPMKRIGRPRDMAGVCVFLAVTRRRTSTARRFWSTAASSAPFDLPALIRTP